MNSLHNCIQPCLCSASLMGLLNPSAGNFFAYDGRVSDHKEDFREYTRVAGAFNVEIVVNGLTLRCITHNISYNGLFIETGQAFSIGQKISIVIKKTLPNINFQADGIIVRNSPHGIGVKLIRN